MSYGLSKKQYQVKYRINGFDQLKAFYSWCFNNQEKVRAHHISLYVFLLNQNNRNNWVEWFKCPLDLGMAGGCVGSKVTYYKVLNDLQKWNLIKYKDGQNQWKAPLIKLEVLKWTPTDTSSDVASVPSSEPVVDQALLPLPNPIYNLITNNLQLVTDNLERWISETDSKELEIKTDEGHEAFELICKKLKLSDNNPKQIERLTRYIAIRELREEVSYFLNQSKGFFENEKEQYWGKLDSFLGDEGIMSGRWNETTYGQESDSQNWDAVDEELKRLGV